MTDSYASTGNGDLSLTPNGSNKVNGSSPSLPPAPSEAGTTPIIRKKLMGFVGFANLPNQVHRKSVRKGFQFTAMVVGMCWLCLRRSRSSVQFVSHTGESGLGKSTLINTLFNTTLYPPKEPLPPSAERPQTVAIESISAGELRANVCRIVPLFSSTFLCPQTSRRMV